MSPWFVFVPPKTVTSVLPAIKLPLPSAVKLPTTLMGPALLNPLSRKAYCPVSLALFGFAAALVMVTVVVSALVESATDVAVTSTVGGLGTVAGAVYFPVVSIIPQLVPVQLDPETLQVTDWSAPMGLTVTVNCCSPPA